MTQQLTFIHAADLHLGAPFRGLRALSEKWANRLLTAIPEAYDRVVLAAIEHQVDFVVIAGDIFDTARPSYADYRHFFSGLERLSAAGIPVYLCTGNHDPYTSWKHDFFALPDSVTMLPAEKPGFALYERAGKPLCIIGGRGYYNQTWPIDKNIAEGITRSEAERILGSRAKEVPFGVGVLHTGLHLDPSKAPADPDELLRAGFNYWALGHIHARFVMPEDDPTLVFSGCIQGRDIKETGERGVYLVTLREGMPNELEFIPTASVVWQRIKVDISSCANIPEVGNLVVRELFLENGRAHCEEMCVRITLVGTTPLHEVLSKPGVIQDIRAQINDAYPEFFCDALIDATKRPIDYDALRKESLFPAVFLRVSDSAQNNTDAAMSYVQEEFLRRNIAVPGFLADDIPELICEAQDLVLDILVGGEK